MKTGFLIALLLMILAVPARTQPFFELHPEFQKAPDMCRSAFMQSLQPVEELFVETSFPHPVKLYHQPDDHIIIDLLRSKRPVILLINGNGYSLGLYDTYAQFLARQGFVVIVFQRTFVGPLTTDMFFEAIDAGLTAIDVSPASPIGVVGHSAGAFWALEVARSNADLNIRAVAGLMPKINAGQGGLDGSNAEAYLLVYGSQDEDVKGTGPGVLGPSEAFAAFSQAGTEESTSCARGDCPPPFERFLVFAHGLSHPGVLNEELAPATVGLVGQGSDYLALQDEFCLGVGYVHALMKWKLLNDIRYRRVLTGQAVPDSVREMVTDEADLKGLPAGTPVEVVHRYSPAERVSVQNFETWSSSDLDGVSTDLAYTLVTPGQFLDVPELIRHGSHVMMVQWVARNGAHWIGFKVPQAARDITGLRRVSVDIGHVNGAPEGIAQSATEAQDIWVCITDGEAMGCDAVRNALPPVDLRPANSDLDPPVGHAVLRTIEVSFTAISNITELDRQNIRAVYVAFPEGTRGRAIIDSIEWRE